MKESQRGYSVVEITIALAIVAIVLIGVLIGVNSILWSNKINKTISETNAAVLAIKRQYSKESNYSDLSLMILTDGGNNIWPSSKINQAGGPFASVKNSLGAYVRVMPLKSDYLSIINNSAFVYTLASVPYRACVDLALGLASLADVMMVTDASDRRNNEFVSEVVTSDVVKTLNENVSLSKVSAACGKGSSTTRISLVISRDATGL